MKSGIYKIENTATHRRYIGSSLNADQRMRRHRSQLRRGAHVNRHLQASYNKHGEQVFLFVRLISCPQEYLDKAEQFFMNHYEQDGLFNKVPVASMCNREYREAISKILKDYCRAPEVRARLTAIATGRKWSPEQRQVMAEAFKMRSLNPDWLAKLSIASKGRRPSAATCMKMSVAKQNPEAKARMAVSNKRAFSAATKAKMSASAKARAARPGEKEKRSMARHLAKRGYKHSPETRAKIAEANRHRSPELKEKLRLLHVGAKRSLGTRQKISAAAKRRYAKA